MRDDYWERSEGTPYPLGATLVESNQALNFALYAKHAESVTLLLFGDDSLTEPLLRYLFNPLRNKSGPIWHCRLRLSQVRGAKFYGYQVDGPANRNGIVWHPFDPAKLLLDPYAKAVHFPPTFSREAASPARLERGPGPAGHARSPRLRSRGQGGRSSGTSRATSSTKCTSAVSLAMPTSGVAADKRGTFAGLVEKIPYLASWASRPSS